MHGDPARLVAIDQLAGHIATRRGPVMRGHAILTAAAERADPERAVAMLAEAADAPASTRATAPRCWRSPSARGRRCPPTPRSAPASSPATALGMARILGGDAAAGAEALHAAIALAEGAPELRDDLELLPWLAIGADLPARGRRGALAARRTR